MADELALVADLTGLSRMIVAYSQSNDERADKADKADKAHRSGCGEMEVVRLHKFEWAHDRKLSVLGISRGSRLSAQSRPAPCQPSPAFFLTMIVFV